MDLLIDISSYFEATENGMAKKDGDARTFTTHFYHLTCSLGWQRP